MTSGSVLHTNTRVLAGNIAVGRRGHAGILTLIGGDAALLAGLRRHQQPPQEEGHHPPQRPHGRPQELVSPAICAKTAEDAVLSCCRMADDGVSVICVDSQRCMWSRSGSSRICCTRRVCDWDASPRVSACSTRTVRQCNVVEV